MIKSFSSLQRAVITLRTAQKILIIKSHKGFQALDAICPHSGYFRMVTNLISGPLSLGVIDDIEDSVLVCPWHSFRFQTSSGICDTDSAFNAQVWTVTEDAARFLKIDGVSQEDIENIHYFDFPGLSEPKVEPRMDSITSLDQLNLEKMSLVDYALAILSCPDPILKVKLTFMMQEAWTSGISIPQTENTPIKTIPERPARDSSLTFLKPGATKKIGKGGSIASRLMLLHALANVEQWAIDLAVDMIARFGTGMPQEMMSDFVRMAAEEAKHFTMLKDRLKVLGVMYGDYNMHDGLWDSAKDTKDSVLSRLAIVHMVHEARGLDVNPRTIAKFQNAGDKESVAMLQIIHRDEITHVTTGQKWFDFVCKERGLDKYDEFHAQVRKNFYGLLKPPFNEKDRSEAGLDAKYYLPLSVAIQKET